MKDLKKFVLIDNHHVIFYAKEKRIFIGDLDPADRCKGIQNTKGLSIALQDSPATDEIALKDRQACRGDALAGESGTSGSPRSGGGWTGGASRRHQCMFVGFREVALRP